MIGFAVFFLYALTQERGGWHPAPDEAVTVPLIWLGAVALPICGPRLWRANRRLLREDIARTLADPAQTEEEIRALFSAFQVGNE